MPISVGIVPESHLVLIFQSDQPGHRIGTRTVHPNFAVVINGHERKCGVDYWICNDDVQPVDGIDRLPIGQGRSTQRVHAKPEVSAANRIHVNNILEIANVRQDEIFLVSGRGADGFSKRNALDPCIPCSLQFVRAILYPAGHVDIGWTAIGRVVLEASVLRRIVRWRNDDAVG